MKQDCKWIILEALFGAHGIALYHCIYTCVLKMDILKNIFSTVYSLHQFRVETTLTVQKSNSCPYLPLPKPFMKNQIATPIETEPTQPLRVILLSPLILWQRLW